jgi:hypothetical protein
LLFPPLLVLLLRTGPQQHHDSSLRVLAEPARRFSSEAHNNVP